MAFQDNPRNIPRGDPPDAVSATDRDTFLDGLIEAVDRGLRTLTATPTASRAYPASAQDATLDDAARAHAGALMRVNHSGEICAQALYEGQAATARDTATVDMLRRSADEERDHLAWCERRLEELGAATSALNPLFYAASFGMGAVTGLLGDRLSLGFVEATEDQVQQHLDRHLESLPPADERSREVVRHMRDDEARHGASALAAGGARYPYAVRALMTLVSRVMTASAYRV